MKLRSHLRPGKTNLTLMMIFTLLSLIIVTGLEWTTKMTWYAHRGFPFPFVKIYDFVIGGSCKPYNICFATNVQDFSPLAVLMDLFVWYFVSCTIIAVYQIVKKKREVEKSTP